MIAVYFMPQPSKRVVDQADEGVRIRDKACSGQDEDKIQNMGQDKDKITTCKTVLAPHTERVIKMNIV